MNPLLVDVAIFMLRTRLFLNLVPFVVILLAIGVYAIVLFSRLASSMDVTVMGNYQSLVAAQTMSLALGRMHTGIILVFQNKGGLGQELFAQGQQQFETNLDVQLKSVVVAEGNALSQQLKTNYHAFAQAGREIFTFGQMEEQRILYDQKVYPSLATITELLNGITRLNHEAILNTSEETRRITGRVTRLMLAGLFVALVIASYACYQLSRSILDPILSLTTATRELGEGHFERPVPSTSKTELGELAVAFNKMAGQLQDYRQSARHEIVRLHRTMESTLASFPDPIFVLNCQAGIELMNPAAADLCGALQLNGALPPRLQSVARRVLDNGENYLPESFKEVVSFRFDHREKFYLPRIVAIWNKEDALLGVAVVLYDVTRFRLMDDAKTNLVGTVSHELKTPLTGVRMALYLLLEKAAGDLSARQNELLETARSDTERTLRTLNDLLDLTRLDTDDAELNQEKVSADELIKNALEELGESLTSRGLKVNYVTEPDLAAVWADRERVSHVFTNLISNAIKYSPPDGEILIRAALTPNGDVQFSVLDDGPGVPEEYHSRIFDRFFRVPGQKKTGAGLGLSIAREIVVAHGGRIGVKRRAGQGSEFYFTLPVTGAEKRASGSADRLPDGP